MSRLAIARILSVIGHPALLMPGAVIGSAVSKEAPQQIVWVAASASVFVALSVGLYSLVQVRAGRWRDVDASVPHERRQLNVFLAALLFGAAGVLWWNAQPRSLYLGPGVAGSMVVLAYLLRSRLKLSLHAAFAVFAAALLWPSVLALLLVCLLAAGVSWSRLVLRRHTRQEVLLGLSVGGAAGLGFNLLAG